MKDQICCLPFILRKSVAAAACSCICIDVMQRESTRTSLLAPGLEVLRQTVVHAAVQFSSRWYLCSRKSSYALHPVFQKFPQRWQLVRAAVAIDCRHVRNGHRDKMAGLATERSRHLLSHALPPIFPGYCKGSLKKYPCSSLLIGSVQCCFTSTETVRTIRDVGPRTAISTFTQLLSSEAWSQSRMGTAKSQSRDDFPCRFRPSTIEFVQHEMAPLHPTNLLHIC